MSGTEKDQLSGFVVDQHCAFEQALSARRKRYPTGEFRAFAMAVRKYVQATRGDRMLHRSVVQAASGLVENLRNERKRVPGEVLVEADRLECLLSLGYDPDFDGDEPAGL